TLTDESFTYDQDGNRTGTFTTDVYNRLLTQYLSTTNTTYTYDYDKEGNRTQRTKTTGGTVAEVVSYTWDYRNRLTDVVWRPSVGGAVTKQVHYTYDAFDQRIGKQVDADGNGSYTGPTDLIERYVWAQGELALVLTGSTVTERYLFGPQT